MTVLRGISYYETKKMLTSELTNICDVHSITRFGEILALNTVSRSCNGIAVFLLTVYVDGCETVGNIELSIGESSEISCPCHEYLQMLPESMNQRGRRVCGGSYTYGAQLFDPNFSQCAMVFNDATSALCHAVQVMINPISRYPVELSILCHIHNVNVCRLHIIIH